MVYSNKSFFIASMLTLIVIDPRRQNKSTRPVIILKLPYELQHVNKIVERLVCKCLIVFSQALYYVICIEIIKQRKWRKHERIGQIK